MSNLWSGRFAGEPDKDVFEFGRSFPFDKRLVEDDITGSLAWAEAIAAAGVLSATERADIVRRARGAAGRGRAPTRRSSAATTRTCTPGSSGSWSSGSATPASGCTPAARATSRSASTCGSICGGGWCAIDRLLVRVVAALVAQAEQAGDTLMPAYTHLRRAQPVLAAHWFLSHAAAFRRDAERIAAVSREADALPLGSGAIAGNSYGIDVHALAARLGFSRVVANSMDAVADRDFVSSFLHAVSLCMVHVSRLAEDIIIFGSEEFGFVDLDDRISTGSSLMPQKKNPDPMELVRGKAGRAIGRLTGFLTTMKGLPSGYNKDLQEDKEAVFDAEDTIIGSLISAAAVVETLTLKRAARTPPPAASCSPPTSPIIWSDAVCPSGKPTRSSPAWSGR